MSLMLMGSALAVSSIAISALLVSPLRFAGSRRARLDVERCKTRLLDIDARLKIGKLSEAEADAARIELLSQLRSPGWAFGAELRSAPRTLIAPAAVFLLVAGIGTAASYMAGAPEAPGLVEASGSGSANEVLASLADYTRSIEAEGPASAAADGNLLPDVNTMIERLAARLEAAPEDVNGWKLLGWSYFQMQRHDEAVTAFAKALELDPSSAEIKRAYENAKAKASGNAAPEPATSVQTGAVGGGGGEPGGETIADTKTKPPHDQEAQIRSMVDGLAKRLESSPRDVEGWTRLMRSRVVLGEREVAATAFRKALDVFKDDFAASSKLTAAAIELDLKAN